MLIVMGLDGWRKIWRQKGTKMVQFQRKIGDFRLLLVRFQLKVVSLERECQGQTFLLMFLPSQLTQCTLLTNITLRRDKLKYFGILILLSKFEFNKRKDLWSNISQHICSCSIHGEDRDAKESFRSVVEVYVLEPTSIKQTSSHEALAIQMEVGR